jgi:hypothetical protein
MSSRSLLVAHLAVPYAQRDCTRLFDAAAITTPQTTNDHGDAQTVKTAAAYAPATDAAINITRHGV